MMPVTAGLISPVEDKRMSCLFLAADEGEVIVVERQRTAWEEVERKGRLQAFGADRRDDGVAGVIPACESCTDIGIGR